jgi:hypothetical protein
MEDEQNLPATSGSGESETPAPALDHPGTATGKETSIRAWITSLARRGVKAPFCGKRLQRDFIQTERGSEYPCHLVVQRKRFLNLRDLASLFSSHHIHHLPQNFEDILLELTPLPELKMKVDAETDGDSHVSKVLKDEVDNAHSFW